MRPGELTDLQPEGASFQRQRDMPQKSTMTSGQMVTKELTHRAYRATPVL